MKEDLSRPYESWTTSPAASNQSAWKRIGMASFVVLGVVIAVAVVNAWVLVSDSLRPLWSRPPVLSFVVVGALLFTGVALVYLAPLFKRWQPRVMMAGLVLALPFGVLFFSPLFLYLNQAADFCPPQCSSHLIVRKEVIESKRKRHSYDIVLRASDQQIRTVRVSRTQFDSLHEGQLLGIQVGQGFFGIQYVEKFRPKEASNCSH